MIPYNLNLDYAFQPGWLAPFFDALRAGRALGWRCDDCGSVSFPPLRTRACGGRDGAFALARFEGAERMATVRLEGFAEDVRFGQLRPADEDLPHLCLIPVDDEFK